MMSSECWDFVRCGGWEALPCVDKLGVGPLAALWRSTVKVQAPLYFALT